MDDLDEHLLARLRENARAPVAELARALGLSRTTVQSRIARLERRGVIAGYAVRTSQAHEQAQQEGSEGIEPITPPLNGRHPRKGRVRDEGGQEAECRGRARRPCCSNNNRSRRSTHESAWSGVL